MPRSWPASLDDDGPLLVYPEHWLNCVLPLAASGTDRRTNLRQLHFIVVAHMAFAPEVDDLHLPFWVHPSRVARFLLRLLQAGIVENLVSPARSDFSGK